MQIPSAILGVIKAKALQHRIEPALLAAFTAVESSGDPGATRHEPKTRKFVVDAEVLRYSRAAGVTVGEEIFQQMTSWGLMQVMGFNCRELGFRGKLTDLVDPELGLEMGACWLKHLQVM